MRKIKNFPRVDDFKILHRLSNPPTSPIASRNILSNNRALLSQAYSRYAREFSNPRTLTENILGLSNAAIVLRNKYDSASGTNALNFIETRRHKNDCGCCPFCGNVALGTLDHYLPKDNGYGHFSILSSNLVPMCEKCQSKKRAFVPIGNLDRFIHPYFDEVNDVVELKITPVIDDLAPEAPKFRYEAKQVRKQQGDALLAKIVKNHIQRMQLETREDLRLVLLSEWRGILRSCVRAIKRGGSVKAHIADAHQTAKDKIPIGCDETLLDIKYDVVLLRTIENSADLIHWMSNYAASQVVGATTAGLVAR